MIPPETRYTQVGDSWIGYQVVGDGPVDLVFVSGVVSNIETMWEFPAYARMLERLASFSRLILFDARGSGVSDPIDFEPVPTWEHWTEDLRAVLDAAGSERSSLLAQYDGGPRSILFAATNPERTASLVLWNSYARSAIADGYLIGSKPDEQDAIYDALQQVWGTTAMMRVIDPSFADNVEHVRWGAKFMRTSVTPGRAVAIMRYADGLDVRGVLPAVRVPTLIFHRRENNFIPIERGRYLADNIRDARFVELPGADLNIFAQSDEVTDEIEEFLTGTRRLIEPDRQLATVMFTDIVGSTEKAASLGDRRWKELLERHDRTSQELIAGARGRLVNTMGDGVLATFDGPGRAIRCAFALGRALRAEGIEIRAGVHTGEIELRDEGDVGGIAVHIAARVMGEAGPGEVVCSRTVKDLVAGSEFAFKDRGMHALKGVPDEWQLFAVESR